MLKPALAIGVLMTVAPALASAESYRIDSSHSALIFKAQHMGAGYTYGRFRKFSGSVTMGPKSSVSLQAQTNSIYTGEKKRDLHLMSPDFFNAKQFPMIRFQSTSVQKRGKNYRVTGNLSLHGVTKKVTVNMKMTGKGSFKGKSLVGFEGTFKIKRSDFAMKKLIGPVSDTIWVTVAIEAVN
jgi:polyisoprenoid-binding protein YceI